MKDEGEKSCLDVSRTNCYNVNGSEKENGKLHKEEKNKNGERYV